MADIREFPRSARSAEQAGERELTQVFLTTDAIGIRPKHEGVAEITFGPVSVNMTYDAIHDLTYRLAAFIAVCEGDEEYCQALLSPPEKAAPSPQSTLRSISNSSSDDE